MTLTSEVRLSHKTLFFNRSLVHSSARDQFRKYHLSDSIPEDTLWVQFPALPSKNFDGSPENFLRQCHFQSRLFLECLVCFETLFFLEMLRGEDSTTGEDPFPGEVYFL